MSNDYKKDISVDIFALHLCYREQPSNYMDWAEKWANKVEERSLRVRFLRNDIRKNPEKYDLPSNPSQAAMDALLEEDEKLIQLTKQQNILESAKKSLEQRLKSLDGLVRLYLNGYFSGPHPATTQIKQERGQRVRKQQIDALQHNTRIGGGRRDADTSRNDQQTEARSPTQAQGIDGED